MFGDDEVDGGGSDCGGVGGEDTGGNDGVDREKRPDRELPA